MRIGDKKRLFIFLSCLLLQSDARMSCSQGFEATLSMNDRPGSSRDFSQFEDFECDDGQKCAMFELKQLLKNPNKQGR